MDLKTCPLPRNFYLHGRKLPDPDPNMPIQDVRSLLSTTYPELNNSSYTEEVTEKERKVTFSASVGHKG